MEIEIKIIHDLKNPYVILDFVCGMIDPRELASYKPIDPVEMGFANKGVIIKGSMPLWLISYYTHVLHPVLFIAVSVPRMDFKAAVVVATHTKLQMVGNIIYFEM